MDEADERRRDDILAADGGLIGSTRGVRKVCKPREGEGFTIEKRAAFLDGLAATCNIGKAAAYAGIGVSSVYRARNRDAAFAEQWQTAMAIGYDRLEALVLEHGGAGGVIECDPERAEAGGIGAGGIGAGGIGAAGSAAVEPFDFERAMTVLRYARAARQGEPNRRTGRPPKMPTRGEINTALLKALSAERERADAQREE